MKSVYLHKKINDLYVENKILQTVREYPLIIARLLNIFYTKK